VIKPTQGKNAPLKRKGRRLVASIARAFYLRSMALRFKIEVVEERSEKPVSSPESRDRPKDLSITIPLYEFLCAGVVCIFSSTFTQIDAVIFHVHNVITFESNPKKHTKQP
jgi:hypothetical protein